MTAGSSVIIHIRGPPHWTPKSGDYEIRQIIRTSDLPPAPRPGLFHVRLRCYGWATAGALVNVREGNREIIVGRFYAGSGGDVEIVY
jgi:hypothetical protein